MDKFRIIMLQPARLLTVCSILCCHGYRAKAEGRASQPELFAHERRAVLATDAWGGMRVTEKLDVAASLLTKEAKADLGIH